MEADYQQQQFGWVYWWACGVLLRYSSDQYQRYPLPTPLPTQKPMKCWRYLFEYSNRYVKW